MKNCEFRIADCERAAVSRCDEGNCAHVQLLLSSGNVEFVFVPEPQHQQRAKNRNDDPGRMKLCARFGTREDMRHQSADN